MADKNNSKIKNIKILLNPKEKEKFEKESKALGLSQSDYGKTLMILGEFDIKEEFNNMKPEDYLRELRTTVKVFLKLAGRNNPSYSFLEKVHTNLKGGGE